MHPVAQELPRQAWPRGRASGDDGGARRCRLTTRMCRSLTMPRKDVGRWAGPRRRAAAGTLLCPSGMTPVQSIRSCRAAADRSMAVPVRAARRPAAPLLSVPNTPERRPRRLECARRPPKGHRYRRCPWTDHSARNGKRLPRQTWALAGVDVTLLNLVPQRHVVDVQQGLDMRRRRSLNLLRRMMSLCPASATLAGFALSRNEVAGACFRAREH